MKVIEDVTKLEERFQRLVLTVGSFDGVHLGHQRVLQIVVEHAKRISGVAGVMTIKPHPREFFTSQHSPNLLTSDSKKIELMERAGIDVIFILPFNEETSALSPRAYVENILYERCRVAEIIVGHDFQFGKNAEGDYDFLRQVADEFQFSAFQVPPMVINGERISSTVIRERLFDGDLDEVEKFLGRKYSIRGEVISGRGIGTTLGFPTANILPHHTAIPAQGVYAAEVFLDGSRYPAAVNIGVAPTIKNSEIVIEAFILGFEGNLRGTEIEILFHKRLRPERKFASQEELISAIKNDVENVRSQFLS
jgi:riboflavin kinase/FMN adenylyltransferase